MAGRAAIERPRPAERKPAEQPNRAPAIGAREDQARRSAIAERRTERELAERERATAREAVVLRPAELPPEPEPLPEEPAPAFEAQKPAPEQDPELAPAAPRAPEKKAAPEAKQEKKREPEAEEELPRPEGGGPPEIPVFSPSRGPEMMGALRRGAEGGFQELEADLAANPPSIERPTGIPRKGEAAEDDRTVRRKGKARNVAAPPGEQTKIDTKHDPALGPIPQPPAAVIRAVDNAPEEGDALAAAATEALNAMPVRDNSVDTSAGPRPKVELVGEAAPSQIDDNLAEKRGTLDAEWTTARGDAAKEYGENDIYPVVPRETLTAKIPKNKPLKAGGPRSKPGFAPDEIKARFDQEAEPHWGPELAKAQADDQAARAKKDADENAEREKTDREIAGLKEGTKKDQLAARRRGQDEVAGAKEDWISSLDEHEKTYSEESTKLSNEARTKIAAEKKKGDDEAKSKLDEAEKDARAKKAQAEREAAAKKAEEKKSSGGFFGWLKRKVKAAIAAIKKAINEIFDAVRAAIKFVINKAKELAVWAIEQARKAIVACIRGFGALLEAACDVFLAAFPAVRDKAKALIRKGVATAEKAVNDAADALKKGVCALLDALGAVLDAILEFYQKAYNAILDVIEFLIIGLIEILEGLARLAEAAGLVPDFFWGQFSEEGLGIDLTQPLPFEKPADAAKTPADAAPLEERDAEVAAKTELTEGDVAVDRVGTLADLDPEFLASLDLKEGKVIDFGEINDEEHATDTVKGEALAPTNAAADSPAPAAAAAAPFDPTKLSPEDQLAYIESTAEKPHTCDMPKTEEPAKATDMPANMRVYGPFTVGQRFSYLMGQIKSGISQWWDCNWKKILLYVGLGVLGFVALLIATGGAILALIPPLLEIIALIMVGAAVFKAMGYVQDWVTKAWGGDIQGGGKALTRGLIILLIELIFALLFNLGAVIKSIKGGLKAIVRDAGALAKNTVKTAVKNVRALGSAGLKTGKAVLKNGKLLMTGVKTGFGKGARSLKDLAARLWKAVRFRKFRIVFSGGWFKLLGYVNPWVLILEGPMKGTMKHVDDDALELAKGVKREVGAVGKLTGEADDAARAVIVSTKGPKHVPDEYREIYNAWLKGLKKVGAEGAEHLPDDVAEYIVHHLIEQQAFEKFAAALNGLMKNAPSNLRLIPRGAINSVVHLSRIRVMWNSLYRALAKQSDKVKLLALQAYAKYTDDFIREALKTADDLAKKGLSDDAFKAQLRDACDAWLKNNQFRDAITKTIGDIIT